MLKQRLKDSISAAVKESDSLARDVLRVVLGQIQTEESRAAITEERQESIVRKLIKSNQTTIEQMQQIPRSEWSMEWTENEPKLQRENEILARLLPQCWDVDQIKEWLAQNGIDIVGAKSDGQAIGMAMKALKTAEAPIDNTTVKSVVESMRKPLH